jgi:glycosyltransferase involved in cell wall biosynthesis
MYHANLLGYFAGNLAGVPHLIWGIRCSDMDLSHYSGLTRMVVRAGAWLSSRPDAVIVNSVAGMEDHIRNGFNRSRMLVIHNGFNLEIFRPNEAAREKLREALGLKPDARLIGLVARYDPAKDHETFIRAAGILRRQLPDVHFILCGGGITPENNDLTRMILANDVADCVHLLGIRDDIPELNAAFDIATSSSAYGEGCCNALAEAMSCGIPCVGTAVGDNQFIVGTAGKIVPVRSPEGLALAWRELLQLPPERRQELSAAARDHIRANLSMDTFIRHHEQVYDSVLCGAPVATI